MWNPKMYCVVTTINIKNRNYRINLIIHYNHSYSDTSGITNCLYDQDSQWLTAFFHFPLSNIFIEFSVYFQREAGLAKHNWDQHIIENFWGMCDCFTHANIYIWI